ncbi:hypothetical protein D3C73_1249890 [compost metagenome]
MLLPPDVQLIAATGLDSADFTAPPCGGQRRKQMDFTEMALQQHLGNPCGSAEITVNLKRRMGVEQVRIR